MAGELFWCFVSCRIFEKYALNNGGANFIVTSSINSIFRRQLEAPIAPQKRPSQKLLKVCPLTYFGTNLKFSTIYSGSVAEGLKGNLPFTWKPEKMARYMAAFATKGKSHGEPSLFLSAVSLTLPPPII